MWARTASSRRSIGHPAFLRFARFRGTGLQVALIALKSAAKRRKPQKVGHLSVPAFRGRALADIRDNQQNARGPLAIRQRQNAETRDLGLKTRGVRRERRGTLVI